MKKQVFKRTVLESLKAMLAPVLCVSLALVIAIYGLGQAELSSRAEGLRTLEESLKRAAITCYAIEGRYPASLSHMEEDYGVYIDHSRYVVFYEIFASNVMPAIVVLDRSVQLGE